MFEIQHVSHQDKDVTFIISCHVKSGLNSFRDDSPEIKINSKKHTAESYRSIFYESVLLGREKKGRSRRENKEKRREERSRGKEKGCS